ncbi:Hpt domain-containing protein [Vibrio metschnikovii]
MLEQILIVNIEDIKDLESAFNEQNFIRCKSIAHKMKSGANIIGCKQILEKCSNIEDSLSLEKAESHVKDLISLTSIINGQIKMKYKLINGLPLSNIKLSFVRIPLFLVVISYDVCGFSYSFKFLSK